MELLAQLMPMLLIGGMMYLFMIRPQQKAAQEKKKMLDAMKKGDGVITIGGLHGVVDEVNTQNGTVVLDCEGIYLTFEVSAIAMVKQSVHAGATPLEDVKSKQTAAE